MQGRYREAAEAYGRAGATRDAKHMRALLEQRVEEAAAMVLSTAGISDCVTPSLQPDLRPSAGQSARLATATHVRRSCLLVLNRQSSRAVPVLMTASVPGVADGPCMCLCRAQTSIECRWHQHDRGTDWNQLKCRVRGCRRCSSEGGTINAVSTTSFFLVASLQNDMCCSTFEQLHTGYEKAGGKRRHRCSHS